MAADLLSDPERYQEMRRASRRRAETFATDPVVDRYEEVLGCEVGQIVKSLVVRKHDGTIEIRSEEGRGTEVTVSLPRWDG